MILELDLELIENMNSEKNIDEYMKGWLKELSRECAISFLEELKNLKEVIKDLEDFE